jgi:hypothetical protein
LACFCGIICLIFECIYLLRFINLDHDLKSGELKQIDVSNKTSPSGNMGTNLEELHTPKSTPKKLGDGGDKKKKLDLDNVFCENEASQEVDIMFWEFSKRKSILLGNS